jgi:hypothetical protein
MVIPLTMLPGGACMSEISANYSPAFDSIDADGAIIVTENACVARCRQNAWDARSRRRNG